jgi:hypothetical protein
MGWLFTAASVSGAGTFVCAYLGLGRGSSFQARMQTCRTQSAPLSMAALLWLRLRQKLQISTESTSPQEKSAFAI